MYPRSHNFRPVYSSDRGRVCPECGAALGNCDCRGGGRGRGGGSGGRRAGGDRSGRATAMPRDGVVRVSRETKGRKGKGVTVVTGVPLAGAELATLAKTLKQRCGSGGTVREGRIEIQGEHRDAVVELLRARGWTVKRAGG